MLQVLESTNKENIRLFTNTTQERCALVFQEPNLEEYRKYYRIVILNLEKNEKVGEVQFEFFSSPYKHVYLHNIMVHNKKDFKKGYAFFANRFLHEICASKLFDQIEGKFYPKEPATLEEVKGFYERNNYSIEKDGYQTMVFGRVLKHEVLKTKKTITKTENGYLMYGSIKDMVKPLEDERTK